MARLAPVVSTAPACTLGDAAPWASSSEAPGLASSSIPTAAGRMIDMTARSPVASRFRNPSNCRSAQRSDNCGVTALIMDTAAMAYGICKKV